MTKDWTGNKKSVFTSLGASSHAIEEREKHDYYATEVHLFNFCADIGSSTSIPCLRQYFTVMCKATDRLR